MKQEVVVDFLHESGKNFIEIAKELKCSAKEAAVLWVKAQKAKEQFKTKEKVVYRKRLINKVRRKARSS